MDLYSFDRAFEAQSPSTAAQDLFPNPFHIAGVDEAGRGPLAGPVVAAAVVLPPNPIIVGINDSKALTSAKRESLFIEIEKKAICFAVAIIDRVEIDKLNIFQATMKAMRQAVQNLPQKPNIVLIDGNQKPKSGFLEEAIVKGDAKSASIAAASIIAKVTRDRIMADLHKTYPNYGFDKHKGYGSALHMEAIKKFGPCPEHRRSFEPVKSMRLAVSSLN